MIFASLDLCSRESSGPLTPCPVGWHPFYIGMPKFFQLYPTH
jgi:hypothetical protein